MGAHQGTHCGGVVAGREYLPHRNGPEPPLAAIAAGSSVGVVAVVGKETPWPSEPFSFPGGGGRRGLTGLQESVESGAVDHRYVELFGSPQLGHSWVRAHDDRERALGDGSGGLAASLHDGLL